MRISGKTLFVLRKQICVLCPTDKDCSELVYLCNPWLCTINFPVIHPSGNIIHLIVGVWVSSIDSSGFRLSA